MFIPTTSAAPVSARNRHADGFAARAPMLARPVRRPRDFGVGYGSSNGYAGRERYARETVSPRFRVV